MSLLDASTLCKTNLEYPACSVLNLAVSANFFRKPYQLGSATLYGFMGRHEFQKSDLLRFTALVHPVLAWVLI